MRSVTLKKTEHRSLECFLGAILENRMDREPGGKLKIGENWLPRVSRLDAILRDLDEEEISVLSYEDFDCEAVRYLAEKYSWSERDLDLLNCFRSAATNQWCHDYRWRMELDIRVAVTVDYPYIPDMRGDIADALSGEVDWSSSSSGIRGMRLVRMSRTNP